MADFDFPDVQPKAEVDEVGAGKDRPSSAIATGSTTAAPKREDFVVLKYLGEGSVGAVMQVKHKETGDIYALKAVDKQRIEEHDLGERLLVEARVQMRVQHPNLLRCYNTFEDRGSIYLLLEYAEGGDLHRLVKCRGRLNEADAAYVFSQVVEGVQHLHKQGIIHRDLKAENILLDDELHVKVGDFGWCAEVEGRTTFCGTPCMLAPEMIQGKPYDRSVDIWSVGVLLFEMLCGTSPFDRGGGLLETCQNIVVVGLEDDQLRKAPEATHSLIKGLLHKDAESRISLERVLRHRWVIEKRGIRKGTPVILEGDEDEDRLSPRVDTEPAVASATTAPVRPEESQQPNACHFFMGTDRNLGGDLDGTSPSSGNNTPKSQRPNAKHFFMGTDRGLGHALDGTSGATIGSDHDVSWAIPPTNSVTSAPPTSARVECILSPVQSIDVLPSPENSLSPASTTHTPAPVVPPPFLKEPALSIGLAHEERTFAIGTSETQGGRLTESDPFKSVPRLQPFVSEEPDQIQAMSHQRQEPEKYQSSDSEQPRANRLLSLDSGGSERDKGSKGQRVERLPPITSALCGPIRSEMKPKPTKPAERLQALDLTPPSSPRRELAAPENPRGGYLMTLSSGNLSQYRPGSTQKLVLQAEADLPQSRDPTFDITSPLLNSLGSRQPEPKINRLKLEILGKGGAARGNIDPPPPVDRPPGGGCPFSILRAAADREAEMQAYGRSDLPEPSGLQNTSGYDLPSTRRDLPRGKAPSPGGGYRGMREAPRHGVSGRENGPGFEDDPPRQPPRQEQPGAFRSHERKNPQSYDSWPGASHERKNPQSYDSSMEGRDVRRASDGFMENDAWMRQQGESQSQGNNNLLDMAMKWAGLQPPDPIEELQMHMDRFTPQQFDLFNKLVTLGFEERLAGEACRRASSVEAAVEWILKNT